MGVLLGESKGKPFGGTKQDQVRSRTSKWGTCTPLRLEQRSSFVCEACLGRGGSQTNKTAVVVAEGEKKVERVLGISCTRFLASVGKVKVPSQGSKSEPK